MIERYLISNHATFGIQELGADLGVFHPKNVKHGFWHHPSKIYSKAQTNDQGKNGPALVKKKKKRKEADGYSETQL